MKAFGIFLLFLIITGCKTTDDVLIKSLSEDAKNKVTSIDMLFLKYAGTKDIDLLKKAESFIGELDSESRKNRYFEAKVIALKCQLDILKNDKTAIVGAIMEIEKRNPNEERLYLIKADIEKDPLKKEAIIKTGLEKASENNILKLYLADIYFLKGKFTEGTAMFDDAFVNLNEEYKVFYKKRRDLSFYFVSHPPQNIKSILFLLEDEITVGNLIQVTLNELKDSKKVLDVKSEIVKEVYQKLVADDYFLQINPPGLDEKIKRKDVAFFILHILAKIESDTKLLKKYFKNASTPYSHTENDLSPIPDIRFNDYFYTAVLVLVEREIMELPDGKNFYPENDVGGLEYLDILKKLMKLY